jgi:hypothetical protein
MKRIVPVNCSEKEFRDRIGLLENTKNEPTIKMNDQINTRKRKALLVQDQIVCQHKNGSTLT